MGASATLISRLADGLVEKVHQDFGPFITIEGRELERPRVLNVLHDPGPNG